MSLRAVLFDLDGVIVDTARFHYRAWKALADRLGIPFDERINERLKGVSRMASLDIVLERAARPFRDDEKAALAAEKNEAYLALCRGLTPAATLPGVTALLAELRGAGVRSAVCSASRSAAMVVNLLQLTDAFDAVLGGDDAPRPKPDPQVFLVARDRFGVASDDCVVVEDAFAGIAAARAAGMKAVGVGDPAILTNADLVVPDLRSFRLRDLRELF